MKAPRTTTTYSMDARKWSIRYSLNLPRRPTQNGTGWFVDLKQDTSEIHMLTCPHTAPITIGNTYWMNGVIDVSSPEVWFDHVTERSPNPGGMPSAFRLYIERDMYGSEYNRWFSNPLCVVMQPGSFSSSVVLSPENWSSVMGKFGNYSAESLAGFKKVLASPKALGIVFGGGDFFGKGVLARNGSAKLHMSNFAIN